MAKSKITEAVKEVENKAKALFEEIKQTQTHINSTLGEIRRYEQELREKEAQAEKVRLEKEKQERLRQILDSDEQLAVHVGGTDETADAPEQAKVISETEPVPETKSVAETKPVSEEKPASKSQPEAVKPIEQTNEKPAAQTAVQAEAKAPVNDVKKASDTTPTQPTQEHKPEIRAVEISKPASTTSPRTAQKPYGDRTRPANNNYSDNRNGGDNRRQGGYDGRKDYRSNNSSTPYNNQSRNSGNTGSTPRSGSYSGNTGSAQRSGSYSGYNNQRSGDKSGDYNARNGNSQQRTSRPAASGGADNRSSRPFTPAYQSPVSKERASNYDPNKSAYDRNNHTNEKKSKNKRSLLKENGMPAKTWDDDTPMGNRRKLKKQQQPVHKPEPVVIEKAILTAEMTSVKDLSEKIGKPVAEIVKKLFILGIMATINQEIDFDTCSLVASDYGIDLELQIAKTAEDVLTESADEVDDEATLMGRPPVVTIMGHVDHGKTSLLDAIRNSSVTDGEAGGITQHIGAYTVTCNGRVITFIDTPGHEAFTSMRARGAQVTDIVILVVAADDGIMPQTIEAINHSKAAGVPIIVAINKMDREAANPDRVKQQLTEYGLVSEEWGGDTICVPVSAKTHMNLDTLLEMVLLQADVLELKANPNRLAKGTIIEAELHKGRGPIATVLVQTGTLRVGDTIVAGTSYGKVRAMMDDKGRRVTSAGPSQPVEVLGFSEVPNAGEILNVAELDKLSRQVAAERKDKQKSEMLKSMQKVSLDDLFSQIAEGQVKELNIIVKADVQGSVEAIKQALEKLSNEEVKVCCIHGGVGAITNTDVIFASASNAIIIGFNVRPDSSAKVAAEREKVDIKLYRVIYNAIEDIQNAMKGMFAPVYAEVELGHISVRSTFKVSSIGTVAGAYVQDGKVTRNAQIRLVRDGIVIHEGKISSLKRFKDDVKEVLAGYECGIAFENFNNIEEGDIIEAFVIEEQQR